MIAQQYVQEFGKLAKTNNTVIMPSEVSNVNQMVTQAMTIFKTINASAVAYNSEPKQIEINNNNQNAK